MQSTWYIFVLLMFIFLVFLPRERRRKYVAKRHIIKNRTIDNKGNERDIMKELAQRFIGKDVYVKLLEGNADGVLKEVTDNGIVLENKNGLQIVNPDYIIKIREYPHKNGKRSVIWGE